MSNRYNQTEPIYTTSDMVSVPDNQPATNSTPIGDALSYASDRIDRLYHTVDLLSEKLTPVLGLELDCKSEDPNKPLEDNRSDLNKRINKLGRRVDDMCDKLCSILDRLEI